MMSVARTPDVVLTIAVTEIVVVQACPGMAGTVWM
jgi:hypothetical protein